MAAEVNAAICLKLGQVANAGTAIMARGVDANLVKPAVRPLFGLTERNAPFNGSALVEWYENTASMFNAEFNLWGNIGKSME